ncbi:hypothetical protein N1851_003739 [Merluccius polli]|uniref:Uncharacterized protein n=1 Tax=Merluccius polli TaxID=89951 RepID=A0AA47N9J7_MERPO|nr:hypothetical protein N1851_003739 [Merluccius polli]
MEAVSAIQGGTVPEQVKVVDQANVVFSAGRLEPEGLKTVGKVYRWPRSANSVVPWWRSLLLSPKLRGAKLTFLFTFMVMVLDVYGGGSNTSNTITLMVMVLDVENAKVVFGNPQWSFSAITSGPEGQESPHDLQEDTFIQWRGRMDEPCERMDEQQRTPLSNQQLAQLIRSLILVEQSQEPSILTSDLKYLQEDLQLKKANVFRSIPYSRFGSNRDAHCYRKAYPHLLAFKVSCQEWGQVLLRSGQWDSALEYGLMAWRYTGELPQWDTAGHNALREQCFAALAAHCLSALRRRGNATEPAKGRELLRRYV